jgi:hypothetical protein
VPECGLRRFAKRAPAGVAPSLRAGVVQRRSASACWSRPSAAPAVTAPNVAFVVPPLPDAAADPSGSSFLLTSRAGSNAAAWLWRHSCAFGDCFKGCHTHASASPVLLGGCRRFGSSICNRRPRQESSSLQSIRPGEASASGGDAAGNALRERHLVKSERVGSRKLRSPAIVSAFAKTSWGNLFGGEPMGRGRANRVRSTTQPSWIAAAESSPWVSGVVGCGQASFGRRPSARSGVGGSDVRPAHNPASIPRPWHWRVGIG